MKRRYLLLTGVLLCSTAFFISYQALSSMAGTFDAYVFASGSGSSPPMFAGSGSDLMAPGDSAKGVLHIKNDTAEPVEVVALSAGPRDNLNRADAFLHSLKLTVKQGSMALFSRTLYSDSMYNFIDAGCSLPAGSIQLAAGDETALEYVVEFDPAAGNESQGQKSNIDFAVHFSGGSDGGNKDSNTNTNENNSNTTNNNQQSPGPSSTSVEPQATSTAPQAPTSTTQSVEPEAPNAAPEPSVVEGPSVEFGELPNTGAEGMAGGGIASLLMGLGGLIMVRASRRTK